MKKHLKKIGILANQIFHVSHQAANMQQVSVVIITKNEARIIATTVESLKGLTDDIVIADTGSTDNTRDIAKSLGCRVESLAWEGFGKTKNKAVALARYDWILFLDADEPIDRDLFKSIKTLEPPDISTVYKVRFKNYFGKKQIRFGEWGNECKVKLFNRKFTSWEPSDIHEKIIVPDNAEEKVLDGFLLHYLVDNLREYADKMNKYADLVAQKYYAEGKRAGWIKLYLYPFSQFIINYIFKLGIFDGRTGFIISFFSSYYAFLKYHRLEELIETEKKAG